MRGIEAMLQIQYDGEGSEKMRKHREVKRMKNRAVYHRIGKKFAAAVLCAAMLCNSMPEGVFWATAKAQEQTSSQGQETMQEVTEQQPTEETMVNTETTVSANKAVEDNASEPEASLPLEATQTIDGIKIQVTAEAGVFPNGAVLHAERVQSKAEEAKIKDSIEENLTGNAKVEKAYAFDITITDTEGSELQPDTTKGSVQVTFQNIDTTEAENSNPDTGIEVYYVADDYSMAEPVAEDKVTAENDEVTFEAEHFSLYAVVVVGNDTTKEYALNTTKLITDILDDLGVSYTTVNSVSSSKTEVVTVGESGNDTTVTPVGNGTSNIVVNFDADINLTIQMTVVNAIYLNPSTGKDINSGESADEGTGPVQTFEHALSLLPGNQKSTIIQLGGANVIATDTTIDLSTGTKEVTLKRYSGFNGNMFTINNDKKLTLKQITIDSSGNEDKNIVAVTSNAVLCIDSNVIMEQGGVFALETGAKPIELLDTPVDHTIYTLGGAQITDGAVLVHTNGLQKVLPYFALTTEKSAAFYLALDSNDDIIAVARAGYGDAIYLSGSGADTNHGATPEKAVKTYERAVALCQEMNIATIKICGTLSVTASQTLKAATLTDETAIIIQRADTFTGSLWNVTGGTLTLNGLTVSNTVGDTTGTIIAANGGKVLLSSTTVLRTGKGTGIYVQTGSVDYASGKIQVASGGTGIRIGSEGTLSLSAAEELGGAGACAIENSGTFVMRANTKITGYITLSGKPMQLNNGPTYQYQLKLNGFAEGDTVVSGGQITYDGYASYITLTSDTEGCLLRDATTSNLLYSNANAIYLDPKNGNDDYNGKTVNNAKKTLDAAYQVVTENAKVQNIYIMNTVTIADGDSITLLGAGTSQTKTLHIYPYKASRYSTVAPLFNVTGGTLTLGKVSILGESETSPTITLSGGTITAGEGASISGGEPSVQITGGMLDIPAGSVSAITRGNAGTIKLYEKTEVGSNIKLTNTTAPEDEADAPIILGNTLTTKTFGISFAKTEDWVDKKLVAAQDGTAAFTSLGQLRVPRECSLEQGSDGNVQFLYLRTSSSQLVYLNGVDGEDTHDGLSKLRAVKTFEKAKEVSNNHNGLDIIILNTVTVTDTQNWSFKTVADGGDWPNATPIPMLYRDTNLTNNYMVLVNESGQLTLDHITLDGYEVQATYAGVGLTSKTAAITMNQDSVIQNCVNSSRDESYCGGGIRQECGTLTIQANAKITGNSSAYYGGGIFQTQNTKTTSKLNILGNAEISENKAGQGGWGSGGGIAQNGGILTIEGNTKITQNIADGCGGGIHQGSGTMTIKGAAQITENSSNDRGGGIFLIGGTRTIEGDVLISKNTVSGSGGGIFNYTYPLLIQGNVKIIGNTASNSGGGIFLFASLTLKGNVEISGNTANSGGGIYDGYSATLQENAKISGNTANAGGGVYLTDIMTMEGNSRISGNTATNGSGIYMQGTYQADFPTANLKGGLISGDSDKDRVIYLFKGAVQLYTGDCKVDGVIYLGTKDYPVVVASALTNTENAYQIEVKASTNDYVAGSTVVKPDGTNVTDASQYMSHFSLVNDGYGLDKSGANIILSQEVYVNGVTGDDSATGAGKSPANPRKTLPESLTVGTTYYICGKLTIREDTEITGVSTSRVVRYTGFDVGGVPYTTYSGDLFLIADGATLTLNGVNLAGKRRSTDSYNATGYLVRNQGSLVLSNGATLTDNKKGSVYLAEGKTIKTLDTNTPGTQNGRVTVYMEKPEPSAVVVEGTASNTNINTFGLVTAQAAQYRLEEQGNDLVIASAEVVYLDAEGGVDTNTGLTANDPVKTLDKAHTILGASGGTVYIMNPVPITTATQLTQDNILYKRYAGTSPASFTGDLFQVTGGTLTIKDVVIDGNKARVSDATGSMVDVQTGGTLSIKGSAVLRNNAAYAVKQAGTMTMTDTPSVTGTIYLAAGKTIKGEGLALNAAQPLTLESQTVPSNAEDVVNLVTHTTLPTDCFALVQDGYQLLAQNVTISSKSTPCVVMKLAGATTIYIDGQNGNDDYTGTTPALAVKTLKQAYTKLLNTGGTIAVVNTITLEGTMTCSETAVTEGSNPAVILDSGKTVVIKRYAKPSTQEWTESFTGNLFQVKNGGKLTISKLTLDGHSRSTETEPAVTGTSSLLHIASGGKLILGEDTILQYNSAATGEGGAIRNSGITTLSGTTIIGCQAAKGSAIYQDGTCYFAAGNRLGVQDIYLATGKYLTLTGSQDATLYFTPQAVTVPITLARVSYGTLTGADMLGICALTAEREGCSLSADGQYVKLIREEKPTTITLANKTVTYSGAYEAVGAVVKGSTAAPQYTYYTDAGYTIKTDTTAAGGLAAYKGAPPKKAGTYYVLAQVEADATYGAASEKAVLTIEKKELTATYAGETIIAGETPTYAVSVSGFVAGESAQTLAASEYTAPVVGAVSTNYTNTLTLTPKNGAATNYSFSYVSGDLVINAGPVSITMKRNSIAYTGLDLALYQDDVKKYDLTEEGTSGVYKIATVTGGKYDIYKNGVNTNNYIHATTASTTYALYYYGVTYDANIPLDSVQSGSVPEDHTDYMSGATVMIDTANAGNLAAAGYILRGWSKTKTGNPISNYQIYSNTGTIYAVWEAKETLQSTDFKGLTTPFTYDGQQHPQTITKIDSIQDGEMGIIKVYYKKSGTSDTESTTAPKDAGTYDVLVTVTEGTKYKAVDDANKLLIGTFTINKVELTATYAGETITAGATPGYSVTVNGFANSENAVTAADYTAPTVSCATETTAGTYPLTPAGGTARNYYFTPVAGNLVVNAGETSVTVTKNGSTYTGLTMKLYQGTTEKYTLADAGNTGVYKIDSLAGGTYDIYKNGTDTGKDITANGAVNTQTLVYDTVTYDANVPTGNVKTAGTDVPTDSTEYLFGTVVTADVLNANGLAVAGYILKGWRTNATTGGKESSFTISDAQRTLYAIWEANSYTVTLDQNNASATPGTPNVTADYDSSTLSSIANPTLTDYDFSGWYTKKTGGTEVINAAGKLQANISEEGKTYTGANGTWRCAGAVTLYAHYVVNAGDAAVTVIKDGSPYTGLEIKLYRNGQERYTVTDGVSNGIYTGAHITFDIYQIYINGTDTGETIAVTAPTGNTKQLDYCTLRYDANVPTGKSSTGMVPASREYLSQTMVTPDTANAGNLAVAGYTLKGWSTTADGSAVTSITVSDATKTLYAVWKIKETSDGNNGGNQDGDSDADSGSHSSGSTDTPATIATPAVVIPTIPVIPTVQPSAKLKTVPTESITEIDENGNQGKKLAGLIEAILSSDLSGKEENVNLSISDENGVGVSGKIKNQAGATIGNLAEVITDILTEAEQKAVLAGEKIQIRLYIENQKEPLPQTVQQLFEQSIPENTVVAQQMDLSLLKTINGKASERIARIAVPMQIVMNIPEKFLTTDGTDRTYYMVSLYDAEGNPEITMMKDMDDNPEIITFETDHFTECVLLYEAMAAPESDIVQEKTLTIEDKDADAADRCTLCGFCSQPLGICIFIWLLLLLAVIAITVVVIRMTRKKKSSKQDTE